MTFNMNRVDINLPGNFEDVIIAQNNMSATFLEDYSIVSRKHLEKIINNSERCLVNNTYIIIYIIMGIAV